MNTENISTLKIHKLTKAQYDRELAAGRIDENALYLTPDDGGTSIELDTSLQVAGMAADSKVVGDAIAIINNQLPSIQSIAENAQNEVDALENYVGRFDRKVFCDTILEYNADEQNWYSADLVNFENGKNYSNCVVEIDGITYTNISFDYGFEGWAARGLPSEFNLMIEDFVQAVYMGPGSKEPGFDYSIKIYKTLSNVTASTVIEYIDQNVNELENTISSVYSKGETDNKIASAVSVIDGGTW